MVHRINKKTLHIIISVLWLIPSIVNAIKETETVTSPDGTVTTKERVITYHLPIIEYFIIGIAVLFGGLIAFQGVRVIIRALDLGHTLDSSEIEVDLKNRQIKMKKITQGGIIVLVGGAIMLGAIYFMMTN